MAANRSPIGFEPTREPFSRFREGDAGDLCYVKDGARAIALIHTATHLSHATYNIGGGRAFTNGEVVASLRAAVTGSLSSSRRGKPPGIRKIPTSTSRASATTPASSPDTASKQASRSTSPRFERATHAETDPALTLGSHPGRIPSCSAVSPSRQGRRRGRYVPEPSPWKLGIYLLGNGRPDSSLAS